MEERLRKHVRAVLGDDDGGQRWRLTRLSGRPASGVASADGAAFQHVRRAAMETLTPGQARFLQKKQHSRPKCHKPAFQPAWRAGWREMARRRCCVSCTLCHLLPELHEYHPH